MNTKSFVLAYFAIIFSFLNSGFAANTHVDITVEGPWILYEDYSKTFAPWPVLVLMAPHVGDNKANDTFHLPQINSGDGYYIVRAGEKDANGIYCVAFDNTCKVKGKKKLSIGHYPGTVERPDPTNTVSTKTSIIGPLEVKLPSGAKTWNWIAVSRDNIATTLILPIPNSYSHDGTWPMRFNDHFDKSGKTYLDKPGLAVGVQLHYENGPKQGFSLFDCRDPKPTVDNCKTEASLPRSTYLPNSGTLRIMMRAPNNEDACDPHVRMTHLKRLCLVSMNINDNKGIAFVDPAHNTATRPMYDADILDTGVQPAALTKRCLNSDPQENIALSCTKTNEPMSEESMSPLDEDLSLLSKSMLIDSNSPQEGLQQLLRQFLYLDSIDAEYQALNKEFPRVSQLRWIATLVHGSSENVTEIQANFHASTSSARITLSDLGTLFNELSENQQKHVLDQVQKAGSSADKVSKDLENLVKNGNDCKAAIMKAVLQ